jgi:Carboxypeptidase regulatory-like domain
VVVHARTAAGASGRTAPVPLPDERAVRDVEVVVRAHGTVVVHVVDATTGERVPDEAVRVSIDREWTEARDDQKAYGSTPEGDPRFVEVEPGPHRVFVDPDAHLCPPPAEVAVQAGKTATVRVELERGRTVTGRVVDADGNPVEAYVAFDATWRGVAQYPNTRSGEDGRFVLEAVPPVAGELAAFEDGVGRCSWPDREIAGDLGDLVLATGPRLVGRLPPSMQGQPLACGIDGERSGGMLEVAEDGTFRVHDLDAGTPMAVYLRPEHGAALVLRDLVLAPGEVRDLGEVAFPDSVTLEGRLLDADGAPVRDALVRTLNGWCVSRTITDAEGRFTIDDLPPGPCTLWIEASPLAVTFHDVDVVPGMGAIEVRLAEPGTLEVLLRREDGETLANAPLNVTRLLDTGEPDESRRTILRTDSTGRLRAALPPGPYRVTPHAAAGVTVVGRALEVLLVSGRTTEGEIVVR